MAIDDQDSLVRSHLAEVLGGLTEALKTVEASMAATQPAKVRQVEGDTVCLCASSAAMCSSQCRHVQPGSSECLPSG